MLTIIILALAVIIISGTLSTLETSLYCYPFTTAQLKAKKGGLLAEKALKIREKPFRTIASIAILINTVNTVGSIIIGSLAAQHFSSQGIGIMSAILTFFTITFAEIIPKNVGEKWSHIIFPLAVLPLSWLTIILSPLVFIFELIAKPFSKGSSGFTTSEEEIMLLTHMGVKDGVIKFNEAEIIQKVFRLNDITASDIMTPKSFVRFIDGDKTINETMDLIKETKYSRLPVFKNDSNNIIGLVHTRELLLAISDQKNDKLVSDYVKEVLFIHESTLADELLISFQLKKNQLAIIVDGYSNVIGIASLEDVLEEIVGEIIKEKDVTPELIKRISKREIMAHGQTQIMSINKFFNSTIHDHGTLNGFLIKKFHHVPPKGAMIELDDLFFKIEDSSPKQINLAYIAKKNDNIKEQKI